MKVSRPRGPGRVGDLHTVTPSIGHSRYWRSAPYYPICGSCVRTVAASAAWTRTALVLTDSNIVPAALGGPYHWGALISRSTH